jgi:DNA-binding transcriptional MerR regulator
VDALTIGGLADAAGVNVETIRYYERRGLLAEPPRTPSGYRQYSEGDLWRLRLIARAKRLGFTLAEIGELLSAEHGSAAAVLSAARAKLAALDQQEQELVDRRGRLEQLVDVCQDGDPSDCTALDVVT